METGTLVEWLKQRGEPVSRGDVVAVVETQKGAIEIEVFEDGVLDEYLVDIGQEVPVGTPLASISHHGDDAPVSKYAQPDEAAGGAEVSSVAEKAFVSEEVQEEVRESVPHETAHRDMTHADMTKDLRSRITPAARRFAAQSGLDLSQLAVPLNGVVGLFEVKAMASKPAVQPITGMREAIAAAMARSKREIPHFYLSHTVRIGAMEAFIAKKNANRPPETRLLAGAFILKAVAAATRKYPEFNGHYEDDKFAQSQAVHAGMAVNIRGGGLVAPAIHNADSLDIDTLMQKMLDLVNRVRRGRFRASELADPTITVTSLGDRGVECLHGVIYPPQVAIVGVGTPIESAGVEDGKISVLKTVVISLAADHRVSDGHRGALFLRRIDKLLQEPENL